MSRQNLFLKHQGLRKLTERTKNAIKHLLCFKNTLKYKYNLCFKNVPSISFFIKCVVLNSPEGVRNEEDARLIKNRHIFLHEAEIHRTSNVGPVSKNTIFHDRPLVYTVSETPVYHGHVVDHLSKKTQGFIVDRTKADT